MATRPTKKAWMWRLLQAAVTLGAIAWILSLTDADTLLRAFGRISLATFAGACGVILIAIMIAAYRWQLLFRGFGAPNPPSWPQLARLYLIGQFYNTYLPGGMVGDVVRGVASREAFGERGMTGGIAVVFFERVLGLNGMLLLTAAVTTLHPLRGIQYLTLLGAAGLLSALAILVGLAFARRIAPHLPAPLAALLNALPIPQRFGPILAATGLSVIIHGLAGLTGHVLVASIHPATALWDSMVIVPLALSAAFLPITVSGAGVREAAGASLYGLVDVPESAAVAGLLATWACTAVVAILGGVLTLIKPVRTAEPSSPESTDVG